MWIGTIDAQIAQVHTVRTLRIHAWSRVTSVEPVSTLRLFCVAPTWRPRPRSPAVVRRTTAGVLALVHPVFQEFLLSALETRPLHTRLVRRPERPHPARRGTHEHTTDHVQRGRTRRPLPTRRGDRVARTAVTRTARNPCAEANRRFRRFDKAAIRSTPIDQLDSCGPCNAPVDLFNSYPMHFGCPLPPA